MSPTRKTQSRPGKRNRQSETGTESGRRLYEVIQKGRHGEEATFADTEEADERRTGRFRRFAITVAAVTVIATGVIMMRRRRQRSRMRRYD
jgi:hypothetical protein